MTDRLLQMAAFVHAAESGTFAAAAVKLGISAQMAGRHVAQLEDRLGARLLNRSTHSQSLTDAGVSYLRECKRLFELADAADATVSERNGTPRGTVRLSAPVGIGTTHIAPRLIELMSRHVALKIDLCLSDVVVDVVADGFDCAVRIGALPDSSMVARTLGTYRCIPCASPQYLARRGKPHAPKELEQHDCLDYVFAQRNAPNLWRLTRGNEAVTARVEPKLTCNDSRVLIDAALGGRGVIQVGELKVAHHLAAGHLMRILPDWQGPARPIQVVYAAHKQRTAKLRVVVDWLVESFAGLG